MAISRVGKLKRGSCEGLLWIAYPKGITECLTCSYAGTGIPTVFLAYFIVPEVARRTPAEIDERKHLIKVKRREHKD